MEEKLCTEPKEPDHALEFAIAFGVEKKQKTYRLQTQEAAKPSGKLEPVYAVEKSKTRACFRCREPNCTIELVNFVCMATNHRCRFCKITEHLENCSNKKFPQKQKEILQRLKS